MLGLVLGTTMLVCWWGLRRTVPTSSLVSAVFFAAFFVYSILYYVVPSSKSVSIGAFAVISLLVALGERRRSSFEASSRLPEGLVRTLVVAGLLIGWLALRDAYAHGIGADTVFVPLMGITILSLLGWSLGRGLISGAELARHGAGYIGLSMVTAAVRGNDWITCSTSVTSKCTAAGRIYVGIYDSSNVLTLFAALTLLLALQLPRSTWRVVLIVGLLVIMTITGSRTTLIAIAAVPLLGVIVAATARKKATDVWAARGTVIALLFTMTATIGFRFLYAHPDPFAFSRRGRVWLDIDTFVNPGSVAGLGRSRYKELLAEGHFFLHFPHSQFLLLLFFGGMIAVVLYGILLVVAATAAKAQTRLQLVLAVAPVLFLITHGLTEISWDAGSLDPYYFVVLVVVTSVTSPLKRPREVAARPPTIGSEREDQQGSLWDARARRVGSVGTFDGNPVHLSWPTSQD